MGLRLVIDVPDLVCASCKTAVPGHIDSIDSAGNVYLHCPPGWARGRFEQEPATWSPKRFSVDAFLCEACVAAAAAAPPRTRVVQRDPT
jgi:hypothetical protein